MVVLTFCVHMPPQGDAKATQVSQEDAKMCIHNPRASLPNS